MLFSATTFGLVNRIYAQVIKGAVHAFLGHYFVRCFDSPFKCLGKSEYM